MVSTRLKNIKLDHFLGRDENKKCLKPPPRFEMDGCLVMSTHCSLVKIWWMPSEWNNHFNTWMFRIPSLKDLKDTKINLGLLDKDFILVKCLDGSRMGNQRPYKTQLIEILYMLEKTASSCTIHEGIIPLLKHKLTTCWCDAITKP